MSVSGREIDKLAVEPEKTSSKSPMSMHEDVPVWYDCCSCEAEPYWVEAMNSELSDKKDSKKPK